MCPVNLSLSSELGEASNELSIEPMFPCVRPALEVCSKCLCNLSQRVALPPSIPVVPPLVSVSLRRSILTPPARLSANPPLLPLIVMFFRCDRSRANLQVSPLSVSAGGRSLPSSCQRCWKGKRVARSSSGWSACTCEHRTCGHAVTSSLVSRLRFLNCCKSLRKWELCAPWKASWGKLYLINGSLCRDMPDYFWQFFCLQWFSALKNSINKTRRQTFLFRSLKLSDFDEESYMFLYHDQ